MDDGLRQRVATALGWTVEQTKSCDITALRSMLRMFCPEHVKLIHHLTVLIQTGERR